MSLTLPRIFGPLVGPIPTSYLDDDFNALARTVVGSIAELRTLLKTSAGYAFATGYYAPRDAGGGPYYYDPTDTTSADNGGTIIVAADGGRWKFVYQSLVSVMTFGATGNGTTDDTAAIQAAITFVESNTNAGSFGSATPFLGPVELFAPAGYYKLTAPLVVNGPITIRGDGFAEFSKGTRFVSTVAGNLFTLTATSTAPSFGLRDITLISTIAGAGSLVNASVVGAAQFNSCRFENVCFSNPQQFSCVIVGDDWTFVNCVFDVSGFTGNSIQLGDATAGHVASNVRFTNCNWFNCPTRVFLAYRYRNVTCSNCVVSQLEAGGVNTSNTLYVLDTGNVPATQATGFTWTGGGLEGVQQLAYLGAASINTTFTGITGFFLGNGSNSQAQSFIQANGVINGLTVVGNNFSGNLGAQSFYSDAGFAVSNANIQGNELATATGTGAAIVCGNTTGAVRNNSCTGFVNQSVSEKRATTGTAFAPGLIGAGTAVTVAKTITGAALGDRFDFAPTLGAWPVVVGIEMRGFVSAANTVTVTYRNYTAGGLTPAAHDLVLEVSR